MKIQDLRIGNYVEVINTMHSTDLGFTNYWYQTHITGITTTGINPYFFTGAYVQEMRDGCKIEHIRGIPITTELLIKLGFMSIVGRTSYCELSFYEEIQLDFCWFEMDGFEIWIIDSDEKIWAKNIKYIHQVQNIVYLLTGRELTY